MTLATCDLPPFRANVVPPKNDLDALASGMQLLTRQLENYLGRLLRDVCQDLQGASGISAFIQLSDVPHSYAGHALNQLRVNGSETGLEFFTQTLVTAFTQLSDVPHTYAGSALYFVRVNAGATGLEFFNLTSTLVTAFIQLSDVPHSYTSQGLKAVRVNSGATGLEFFTQALTLLSDFPASYSGAALKVLRVNSGATAVEFHTEAFTDLSDVPSSYSGQALKALRVNAGATAVEFFTQALTLLSDFPASYSGAALKVLRVNAGATAVEFHTEAFTDLSDVPNSYSGQANRVLACNNGETGLTFANQTVSDLTFVHTPRFLTAFIPGSGGTTSLLGAGTLANLGTVTNPAPTNTTVITSYYRSHYLSAAGAGNSSAVRTQTLLVTRGAIAAQGGFKLIWTVGTSTSLTNQRAFWGLTGATTPIGNVNPSTLTDIFGIGYDSGDTVLAVFNNDGAGAATKTPLSASFPVDASSLYRVEMKCGANSSSMDYSVTNLATGASTSGTISSNLPTNTVWLAPQAWANNGTTATQVQLDMVAGYLETAV